MTPEQYADKWVHQVVSEVASSFGTARDEYIRESAAVLGLTVQQLVDRFTICEQIEPDWDLDTHTLRYHCTFWMEPRVDAWTAEP